MDIPFITIHVHNQGILGVTLCLFNYVRAIPPYALIEGLICQYNAYDYHQAHKYSDLRRVSYYRLCPK